MPCPEWKHESITITKPGKKHLLEEPAPMPGTLTCFFDGGTMKRKGTGGYLIFSDTGKLIRGKACWLGDEAKTNN